jgi:hypothetical protein
VVRLDLSNPPVTPQKAEYLSTYGSIRTFSTMARDINAVRGSVAGGMKVLQRAEDDLVWLITVCMTFTCNYQNLTLCQFCFSLLHIT